MRPSDFLIDLNDLWGRLIPGILILFDLYMVQVSFLKTTTLLETISKSAAGYGIFLCGISFRISSWRIVSLPDFSYSSLVKPAHAQRGPSGIGRNGR